MLNFLPQSLPTLHTTYTLPSPCTSLLLLPAGYKFPKLPAPCVEPAVASCSGLLLYSTECSVDYVSLSAGSSCTKKGPPLLYLPPTFPRILKANLAENCEVFVIFENFSKTFLKSFQFSIDICPFSPYLGGFGNGRCVGGVYIEDHEIEGKVCVGVEEGPSGPLWVLEDGEVRAQPGKPGASPPRGRDTCGTAGKRGERKITGAVAWGGKTLWQIFHQVETLPREFEAEEDITAACYGEERVYVGMKNGVLQCLNKKLEPQWKMRLSTKPIRLIEEVCEGKDLFIAPDECKLMHLKLNN